jgi:hypothetical protein
MSEIKIVGDIIQFDGYDIGRVSDTGIPATTMDRFVEAFQEESDRPTPDEVKDLRRETLDLLITKAEDAAKAGMVTVTELKKLVDPTLDDLK